MVAHWWVRETVDDFFQRRKRTALNKACPFNAGLCLTLRHHFSFATYLAANFGCYDKAIDSESCQRSFSLLCTLPSELAVLSNWYLSRRPFFKFQTGRSMTCCFAQNSIHNMLICSTALILLLNHCQTNE